MLGSHHLTTRTDKSHCRPFTDVNTEVQKVTCPVEDAQLVCAELGAKAVILSQ